MSSLIPWFIPLLTLKMSPALTLNSADKTGLGLKIRPAPETAPGLAPGLPPLTT